MENYNIELPDGALGEFITFHEWGNFINNVRNRVKKDTPEYLPNFDRLFNPNYNGLYNNLETLNEEQIQTMYDNEMKTYMGDKSSEDFKFLAEWNSRRK